LRNAMMERRKDANLIQPGRQDVREKRRWYAGDQV
jgi:hypothetical protein